MGNTYEPGRSRWTGITGWLMVASAIGAVLCALTPVSAYPPLTAELVLAGASAVFAACWVVASYRARTGPLDKPSPPTGSRTGDHVLSWIFALGMPLAVAGALMVLCTGSSEDGKRIERLERAGYDNRTVEIARLAGDPVRTPPSEDSDGWYDTDLVLRVPFDSGDREVLLKGYETTRSPEPGMRVEAYFAPAHPEEGVAEYTDMGRARVVIILFALCFAVPLFGGAAAIAKSHMDPSDMEYLRRFRPGVHLPALAILLFGLVLLLPAALEFEVYGYNRLPAFLASLTPVLALTWVVKRS
ncbi:hypothetical protein [Streptomyces sp. TBY4]|uniref:hypothetical protein n=1 Tax=Streptomyces sp. TBY4 TaxID=2962030 RepID=UPI0020B66F09|nr:hypothetical protein [Streptomyces sp. TBY4]MCP3760426.1 hypothetical protein [Streptomyces sp. TBY4]